jgi:hypothetical protein
MTVSELERTMPATELTEWIQFYGVEPFGEYRDDFRAAIVAFTVARSMGGGKSAKLSDFMPFFSDEQAQRNAAHAATRSEAATVSNAFMKASSRLHHKVIRLGKRQERRHGRTR